jgi:RND family efflux transporter MFP subunit
MTVEQPQQEEAKPQTVAKAGWGTAITVIVLLLVLAVGAGVLVYKGINSRTVSANTLAETTRQDAVIAVSVVHPRLGGTEEEVILPGNTQAFTDSPIYARTNGYLKKWYVDIGTHVKTGELLAEIDAPELDHQLQQAKADLATANANLKLAQTTADRWVFLLKTQSVSRQETDEKTGDLNAKKAMVDASENAVHRLEDLQSYEKVTAPFDGIITARNTDVGALIDAGSSTPARELFHLAATKQLRVFVNVPENFDRAAQSGAKAALQLAEYPGRTFTGTLVRNSSAIDTSSRTLLVEVDVENPTGELLPGSYVSVHLKLPGGAGRGLTVPANTILFRSEGMRVGVVREGHAQLIPIAIGRDYGNELEVVSGLTARDEVIVNPADSLISGEAVRVSTPEGKSK